VLERSTAYSRCSSMIKSDVIIAESIADQLNRFLQQPVDVPRARRWFAQC
jgi:hypothetical protein